MRETDHPRRPAGSERGNAMVGALLVLLVLTAMGITYVAVTKTETQIAGNDRRQTQSEYNAEAGIGEALARMSSNDPTVYFGEDLLTGPPHAGWGRYLVMANGNSSRDPNRLSTLTDGLDNDGNGQIDEAGETYPEVLTSQSAQNPISYPWVRVEYKLNSLNQVILFGDHDNNPSTPPVPNMVRGMPILIVSSEGTQGSATQRVQVEAVKVPFMTPQTAVYSESDNFQFNGTQFLISGKDWNPVTGDTLLGSSEVPGIITTGNPSNISAALHNNQLNNVEGSGGEPSVTLSQYDYDLQAMINDYAPMADIVTPGGTYSNGNMPNWGGYDDYHIVHCTGDIHISGAQVGGGLLLIDGNLDVTGSFTWYGLIINMGTITTSGGGSGTHFYGAVMSQGGLNLQQTVGGQADVKYSSMALAKLASFNPYKVSAWTDLP